MRWVVVTVVAGIVGWCVADLAVTPARPRATGGGVAICWPSAYNVMRRLEAKMILTTMEHSDHGILTTVVSE